MVGIHQALQSLPGHTVGIVGDIMLDKYIWGSVTRISPEAPVPVVHVGRESTAPGGAANVAMNIKALGGVPQLAGIIGRDLQGQALMELLECTDLDTSGILQSKSRQTTSKTRVIAGSQQVARIDRESLDSMESEDENHLMHKIDLLCQKAQVIIVSDYGKGCVNSRILEHLSKKKNIKMLIDPKDRNARHYKWGYLMTPNLAEAEQMYGQRIHSRPELTSGGKEIMAAKGLENLLITQGSDGMTLFSGPEKTYHLPTQAQKVFDVTGAGDTVISVIGLGLAGGLSLLKSCILANYAAGYVVGQMGTAWATSKNILDMASRGPTMEIENW